jgi:hypothetical protein
MGPAGSSPRNRNDEVAVDSANPSRSATFRRWFFSTSMRLVSANAAAVSSACAADTFTYGLTHVASPWPPR